MAAKEPKDSKDAAKPDGKPEAKAAGAPKGAGGSKLVPLLLLVNSVLLAGVLALLLVKGGALTHAPKAENADEHAAAEGGHGEKGGHAEKGGHDEKGAKGAGGKEALPGPTVRLADFVVHLRDVDADRYARLAFEIECSDEKAKEALNARMPQIRDAFLSYLSDRTAEDLRGSEAMSKMKSALTQRIGEIAPAAPLRGLYVADLVVQ
ncbi:MAG: flagellar basal body-associated protein FliL [Anaeromyxobacteraceae bacterium]